MAARPSDQSITSGPPDQPHSGVLRARLLGDVELMADGRPLSLSAWPRRSARSLLLLLLATSGHRLPKERAMDVLWPDLPPGRPRSTWYQAVSTLRRTLEPGLVGRSPSAFLSADATTIWLEIAAPSWVDVDAFEAALCRAESVAADEQRAALRAAISLYTGDLLAAEPEVDWAIERREELRNRWQRAILELARLDMQAGEPLATEAALHAVVAGDRTEEEAHRALIRAYLATGERNKAVRQYERCRNALWTDLAIEPSDATRELLATRQSVTPPQSLSQTIGTPGPPHRPPPVAATPFVGRDREMALVEDLLWQPDERMVTLTGPGGVGKTRLAMEVACRREHDDVKVVFVSLAGTRSEHVVLAAVAQALDVGPASSGSLLSAVVRRLAGHQVLLVLDNFEHLAKAAPIIARLLGECPLLTVLTTSRRPLHLAAEHVVEVPPLSLPSGRQPSIAAIERSDALNLFVRRARAASAAFTLTEDNASILVELCTRLDGLPLAIELAAARVRVLPPQAILARLDRRLDVLAGGPIDAPRRQRAMRDAIRWSYDLLTEEEQAVFRRLSVFAGGATLPAATSVAVDIGGREDVNISIDTPPSDTALAPLPRLLETLVEHSLLQSAPGGDGEPRLVMLETVRAFAQELLEASGEAGAVRHRHATHVTAFAESVAPGLERPAQAAELDRLAGEMDNVRAALSWALQQDESSTSLRLATAMAHFWFVRAMPHEGLRWLEASLATTPGVSGPLKTHALLWASALAHLQGDVSRHRDFAKRGLAEARVSDDPFGVALALFQLGVAAEDQRDLDRAAALYEDVLRMMRHIGEPYWIAILLSNLSEINLLRGHLREAARFADNALSHFRALGNEWGLAQGLGAAAAVASANDEPRRAATLLRESLATSLALEDHRGIAGTLAGLAGLLAATGAHQQAAFLLGAAAATGEAGNVLQIAHHAYYERVLTETRAILGSDAFALAWEAGHQLSVTEAIAQAEGVAQRVEAPANVVPFWRRSRDNLEADTESGCRLVE
jgi:predicted ATPase/DNA-binding SARP family transcriptional activator